MDAEVMHSGCSEGAEALLKATAWVQIECSQPSACGHALCRSFGSSDLLPVPKAAFWRAALSSSTRLGAIHHTHLRGARKPACSLESSV